MAQTYAFKSGIKYARASTPKATVSPSMQDLGWAAGFLEGEGSFAHNSHKTHLSQIARATQKDLEPLRKLQALFGGTVRVRRSDGYAEWRTYGACARGVMFTLFSMLSGRRRNQIRVALAGGY